MSIALTGARVFDGRQILEGHAVVIDRGRILGVPPETGLAAGIARQPVEGLLAPGFIDTQVNGGGGVLFNDERNVDGIRRIAAAHRAFGTTGLMPTFITDTREHMVEAMSAMNDALASHVPGVLGIHVEGPFINPARKGVHDAGFMRPLDDEDLVILTSLVSGRTMVTLAPEMNDLNRIAHLAEAGILVCAGHTAADYEAVMEACDRGLRGFTHLYNAMPPLAGREPSVVGAALDDPRTWCGIIVDGHHVSDAALRIAVAAKGVERMMLVTDAMSVTGTDRTAFTLNGRTIHRADGRLTTDDGTLAGSDLDMATAVRNTINRLGIGTCEALRMASLHPAAFLKLDHELGRIAPGYRANLVLLDDDFVARRTWIDGDDDQS